MISLAQYLHNDFSFSQKMSLNDRKKLIALDREYNELIMLRRDDFNEKDVHNLDEEADKFFSAYDKGEKYYPVLELGECKYDTDGIIEKSNKLLKKFIDFDSCPLSKYYIDNINRTIEWCQFYIDRKAGIDRAWDQSHLSSETYIKALEVLKSSKFESTVNLDRNITAEEAKVMLENALKELKYNNWKVAIEPDMLARMNVLPNNTIRICKTALFSKADIEGLIAHEIKGHVGRRWWGYKTGLYLFVHGLRGRNLLDEGLAVWNSINLVNVAKPNVMFNISLKYVISYQKYRLDFYDLFKFIDNLDLKNKPSRKIIFKAIARAKRENIDTRLLGGVGDDGDYFAGYLLVNDMDDKMRDDILKWNVGLKQLKDIPMIKKFFANNTFDEIKQ